MTAVHVGPSQSFFIVVWNPLKTMRQFLLKDNGNRILMPTCEQDAQYDSPPHKD